MAYDCVIRLNLRLQILKNSFSLQQTFSISRERNYYSDYLKLINQMLYIFRERYGSFVMNIKYQNYNILFIPS